LIVNEAIKQSHRTPRKKQRLRPFAAKIGIGTSPNDIIVGAARASELRFADDDHQQ
jgi:hypothetical protein